jgi:hypothetical protein
MDCIECIDCACCVGGFGGISCAGALVVEAAAAEEAEAVDTGCGEDEKGYDGPGAFAVKVSSASRENAPVGCLLISTDTPQFLQIGHSSESWYQLVYYCQK